MTNPTQPNPNREGESGMFEELIDAYKDSIVTVHNAIEFEVAGGEVEVSDVSAEVTVESEARAALLAAYRTLERTLEESQARVKQFLDNQLPFCEVHGDGITECPCCLAVHLDDQVKSLQSELSALKEKVPYELLESLLAEFPESRFMSMRRQQTAIAVKIVRELRADQSKLKAQVEELRALMADMVRAFEILEPDEIVNSAVLNRMKAALAKLEAG